jgi:hypothetical protein
MTDVRKLRERLKNHPREKPGTRPRFSMPRVRSPITEVFMEAEVRRAEREGAPVVSRDALLALLQETRTSARRERWILLFTAATFFVGLAVLLLTTL